MAHPEHLAKLKEGVPAWNSWRIHSDIVPDLSGANLSRASLVGADLSKADFHAANLYGANLRAANLYGAKLHAANLREAELTEAVLSETVFADTDLTGTRGLETCHHRSPSMLDHRTLARSGNLPVAFLRGCGLPERFIEYLPALLNQPIEFYSCFISYASNDQDFAERLHADLQNKGVRCWFAPEDMKIGDRIRYAIDEAIRGCVTSSW